jgi:hypothetical protein
MFNAQLTVVLYRSAKRLACVNLNIPINTRESKLTDLVHSVYYM